MSPHETKPLFLIQPRLDATEYRDKLIGSVVKYPELPIEKRIPYRSKKQPRELVSDLDPKPIQVHNVRFWQRRIKDADVSASVNEMLESFIKRGKEDSTETVSTMARLWHMDSPGEKFKELLKNKEYFEELFELLRDNHGEGYFITEIVTFVNLEISDETGRSAGIGAGAKVPLDPNTGLKIGTGAHINISRESGHSASYEGEHIVFLGYRKIRLQKVEGTRAKLERAFLGQKHGFAVMYGSDHWPQMEEKPAPGNTPKFLGRESPEREASPEKESDVQQSEEELDEMAKALGVDFEVVA